MCSDRLYRVFFIRGGLIALMLLCLLRPVAPALAEATAVPEPVSYEEYNDNHPDYYDKIYLGLFWPITDDNYQASYDLDQVRQTLQRGGFYNNETPNFGSRMLDQADLNAVREFWYKQTGTNYPTDLGLTYGAKELILTPTAPTAAPHEYKDIEWMQGSPDLPAILDRLYQLHYINDMSHQVYDNDVREAIRAFAANNGFPSYYDNDTEDQVRPITVDLQRRLLESDIKALNEMTETKPEAIPYFLRKVNIAGLSVPMLVLWIVGLIVLVAGVLLVIYLFMPSDKSSDKQKKRIVHFTISYGGKTKVIDVEITKALKIGRGIGNFPLNLEDTKISRKHCELYYLNDVLMLRDYSSNGTTVNGKVVHNAETLLTSGDKITIGNHNITVKF